jgi:ABC-type dipeptide/oligopeptide/nickel transport system permease subunit
MQIGTTAASSWQVLSTVAPLWAGRARQGLVRFSRQNVVGAFSALILLVIGIAAITAPLIAPYSPDVSVDLDPETGIAQYRAIRCPPSWVGGSQTIDRFVVECESTSWHQYLLGTDHSGRDVLSRIIHGATISLMIAVLATVAGDSLGAIFGVLSGYLGGKVDLVSQRILEMLMSFPTLILAMILVVGLGPGVWTVIIAIAATRVPFAVRVVRSVVMSVKENVYVDAARAIGATDLRIMVQHIGPQCLASWMVLVTAHLGIVIILEATLGFLGLGVPEPTATWGNMLGSASDTLIPRWWLVVFPGLAITVTVMAFNMFGDSIRDVLDPKMRGARAEH